MRLEGWQVIALVARYLVRAGMAEEVAGILRQFAPLALGEPGCAAFSVHVALDDPRRILLYEQYRDEAALAAHRETGHYRSVIEQQVLPRIENRERAVYRVLD